MVDRIAEEEAPRIVDERRVAEDELFTHLPSLCLKTIAGLILRDETVCINSIALRFSRCCSCIICSIYSVAHHVQCVYFLLCDEIET